MADKLNIRLAIDTKDPNPDKPKFAKPQEITSRQFVRLMLNTCGFNYSQFDVDLIAAGIDAAESKSESTVKYVISGVFLSQLVYVKVASMDTYSIEAVLNKATQFATFEVANRWLNDNPALQVIGFSVEEVDMNYVPQGGVGPLTVSDFKPGDKVEYVNPPSDSETGVVTSTNDHSVFVKYGSGETSQGTSPEHLRHVYEN